MEAKEQSNSAHNSARSSFVSGRHSDRKTAGYHSGRNSAQTSPRGSVRLGTGDWSMIGYSLFPELLSIRALSLYLVSSPNLTFLTI